MKYFVMIDSEQRGPYALEELIEAGVRPSTYVWCKGMADWQRADEVADICRLFRRHLAERMHPVAVPSPAQEPQPAEEGDDRLHGVPPRFRGYVERSGTEPGEPFDMEPDTSLPPQSVVIPAIFTTLFCFPPTGFVAIYFAVKSRRQWRQAEEASSASGEAIKEGGGVDAEQLRKESHDSLRLAKMWTGITISLGMIMFAVMYIRH